MAGFYHRTYLKIKMPIAICINRITGMPSENLGFLVL